MTLISLWLGLWRGRVHPLHSHCWTPTVVAPVWDIQAQSGIFFPVDWLNPLLKDLNEDKRSQTKQKNKWLPVVRDVISPPPWRFFHGGYLELLSTPHHSLYSLCFHGYMSWGAETAVNLYNLRTHWHHVSNSSMCVLFLNNSQLGPIMSLT